MEMELTKGFVNSCRKVGVLRDFLCQAIDQVDEKDKEIAELEEERRWRKCSEEMPKLQEGVSEIFLVVVENESNTSPKGSYVTIAELCDGEWYNDVTGNEIEENIEGSDYFYRSKVSHWMPLPSAPKEQA